MERKNTDTKYCHIYNCLANSPYGGGLMHVLKRVHSDAERFRRKRIDLKTLLEVN